MEHVVFFPAHDGAPAFRRVPSLEEAVRLVEHLRNVEGINAVSCHALTEVPLAFRAYYRVEVPGEAEPAAVPAQAEPADAASMPEPSATSDTEPSEPAEAAALATAASNGHATDGAKSLGFFA